MMSCARLPGKPRFGRSLTLPRASPRCADAPSLTLPGASSVCSKIAHEEEQELETELILVIGTRNVLCGARQQLG